MFVWVDDIIFDYDVVVFDDIVVCEVIYWGDFFFRRVVERIRIEVVLISFVDFVYFFVDFCMVMVIVLICMGNCVGNM